jgi:hypothetical protein
MQQNDPVLTKRLMLLNGNDYLSFSEIAAKWEAATQLGKDRVIDNLFDRIIRGDFRLYLSTENEAVKWIGEQEINRVICFQKTPYERDTNFIVKWGKAAISATYKEIYCYADSIKAITKQLSLQERTVDNFFSTKFIEAIENLTDIEEIGKIHRQTLLQEGMANSSGDTWRQTYMRFLAALSEHLFIPREDFLRWLRMERYSESTDQITELPSPLEAFSDIHQKHLQPWLEKYRDVFLEDGLSLRLAWHQLNDESDWAYCEAIEIVRGRSKDRARFITATPPQSAKEMMLQQLYAGPVVTMEDERKLDKHVQRMKAIFGRHFKEGRLRMMGLNDDLKDKEIPADTIMQLLNSNEFDFDNSRTRKEYFTGIRVFAEGQHKKHLKETPLHKKERDSLLKLFIGMTVLYYGEDAILKEEVTAKEISDDILTKAGIDINDDTVRKFLREARENYRIFQNSTNLV